MNNPETRTCQNCGNSFVIDAQDFAFYEKIKVPAPTWCPECRLKRRMLWRNERALYKRKCDATGKDIISMYSPDKPFKVYDQKYWWSDKWDPMDYGREYDWNKPFFEQFRELMEEVPRSALFNLESTNSEYCNFVANLKDCYLLFGSWFSENCLYGNTVNESRDSVDNFFVNKCQGVYNCIDCENSYQIFYSKESSSCVDSWFLFDCRNCQNCLFCTNLRNKSYYAFNKPISKKKFREMVANFSGSFKSINEAYSRFRSIIKTKSIHRFMVGKNNRNVTGNFIYNSKNVFEGFFIHGSENVKYAVKSDDQKDTIDVYGCSRGELVYESTANVFSHKSRFIVMGKNVLDSYYLIDCFNVSNCFGCVGLRNKQYCILNKQYTKEEYEKLVPKIIEHMNKMPYVDKKGRVYKYGEFFPPELSPFAYNETIAQEYFPLTKEQAIEKGYRWKDPEQRNIKPDIYTKDLPDNIKDVKDDIVGKVIQCAHAKVKEDGTLEQGCNEQCTTGFKIIPQELEFYRKMNLPLPRLCPNCRHYQRIKQRNPLKLWKRQCMCGGEKSTNGVYTNTAKHFHGKERCPNEFYTTYSPDRKEIVYCEECYKREVG